MVKAIGDDGELEPIYADLVKNIYKGVVETGMIDKATLLDVAKKLIGALFEGYGTELSDIDYDTPDFRMLSHLTRNVYQFAAAKNYQQIKSLTEAVSDGDKVRSFSEYRQEAKKILTDFNSTWLETEYNATIAGGQMASKWVVFQEGAQDMPSLQYRTAGDARVRDGHRLLDGVVKEISDSFWKTYYPPNGWNCRCTVIQLPHKATPTPDKNITKPDIPKLFQTNLAENNLVFPPGSAYYKNCPPEIKKEGDRLLFKAQQDAAVKRLVGKVEVNRPELQSPIIFNAKGIKEAFNQPLNKESYFDKNLMLGKIDQVLQTATYKGYTNYPPDNPAIKGSHIFETTIAKKRSWLIVREHMDGANRFYSVSQSKKVLQGIKKTG